MAGFDREVLLRTLFEALEGERIVFHPGWSGLPEIPLPTQCFVIGDTPHDWLFPRMSLVIHHGGSGTAHSACRAGVPSVVLPFAGDQCFWAHQLARQGLAAAPVPAKKLSADAIRQAIRFARSPQATSRAAALAARMAQENGTAVAVEKITSLLTAART